MFCSDCGREIAESSNFCSSCGRHRHDRVPYKQLTLSATDSKIAGVCGGLAEYLGVDPTVVRLVWVALSVFPGGLIGGAIAYLLAWIIIPKAHVISPAQAGSASVQGTPAAT